MENFEDWRDRLAMIPIKDQGDCNSCWTITVTDLIFMFCMLEEVEGNQLLSAQELLDHVRPYSEREHCSYADAFQYVINKGLARAVDHEYTAIRNIHSDLVQEPRYKIVGYVYVPPNEQEVLELLKNHPLAIRVRIGADAVKAVDENTILEWDSGRKGFNHACILVGYGRRGEDYFWRLRMCWGENWGDRGYGMLRRIPGEVPFKSYYPIIDPQMFTRNH